MKEIIDSSELARRWGVPESWVRSNTRVSRTATANQIPHVQLGRYVRFEWDSPDLEEWWARRREGFSTQKATAPGGLRSRQLST